MACTGNRSSCLTAREAFFLRGGDNAAVDDQCGGRIVIERGNAQNRGHDIGLILYIFPSSFLYFPPNLTLNYTVYHRFHKTGVVWPAKKRNLSTTRRGAENIISLQRDRKNRQ